MDVPKQLEFDELRRENSNTCIRALAGMQVGETMDIGDDQSVMAVPMGWIFYKTCVAGVCGTFVPAPTSGEPPKLKGTIVGEPSIVLPR
jgi:hypothetical protein